MIAQIDRRDHVRADRRGRQVDEPLAVGREPVCVVGVGLRGRRVEDDVDVGELGQGDQPLDAFGRGGEAQACRPREAVGVGIDADQGAHP